MQDKDLPGQSRRLIWKVYAFLLSAILIPSYVYLVANDFQAFEVSDIAASAIGLVGLFGYAYRRKVLQAQLWTAWSIFLPLWDLTSSFVYKVSLASTAIAMAVHVPEYVALWRYGRESGEIWGTSQPND